MSLKVVVVVVVAKFVVVNAAILSACRWFDPRVAKYRFPIRLRFNSRFNDRKSVIWSEVPFAYSLFHRFSIYS